MSDPSDHYTWRDFLLDLEKEGCTAELYENIPVIVRRTPDGRTLRVPITPAGGIERRIYPSQVEYIRMRLHLAD